MILKKKFITVRQNFSLLSLCGYIMCQLSIDRKILSHILENIVKTLFNFIKDQNIFLINLLKCKIPNCLYEPCFLRAK